MSQMFDLFLRSLIVQFIGAATRWLFDHIVNLFKGEPARSFVEIWRGKSKLGDKERLENGLRNVFWGYMTLFLLTAVGFLIDKMFY
jgi:hypothetical protein